MSGILYARTGRALTVTQSQGVLSTGSNTGQQGANRPNRIGDGRSDSPTIDQWFDPTAFQIVPGNHRDVRHGGTQHHEGPGYFNIDASLIKNTKFGKMDLELRVEAFNILNHPAFADPNTTFGTASLRHHQRNAREPSCAVRDDRKERSGLGEAEVLAAGPPRGGDGRGAWRRLGRQPGAGPAGGSPRFR
jgi:hypothetical protein